MVRVQPWPKWERGRVCGWVAGQVLVPQEIRAARQRCFQRTCFRKSSAVLSYQTLRPFIFCYKIIWNKLKFEPNRRWLQIKLTLITLKYEENKKNAYPLIIWSLDRKKAARTFAARFIHRHQGVFLTQTDTLYLHWYLDPYYIELQ